MLFFVITVDWPLPGFEHEQLKQAGRHRSIACPRVQAGRVDAVCAKGPF
jgi:hypothetical protein